jgi:putative PIN family toxin of toxin-antitoxin system
VRAVFDANVIASGVGWQGEGWLCLVKLARRQVEAFGTEQTLAETREAALRIIDEFQPKHNAAGRLTWYLDRVQLVEPSPLGKQRSRDAKDDPYLAAALAARARVIVTCDKDLLELEKPFGIEIVRPAKFLKMVKG